MKTKKQLIDFENWVVETFNAGKLKSPVHLSGGNEDELIKIFKDIKSNDWIFTTYRSHYHSLLKGVPEKRLKDWILSNKSIHFMDSEYKVFSSAIVGGTLPIALGVALAIKRGIDSIEYMSKQLVPELKDMMIVENHASHVYIFIGDMTANTGTFNDCLSYAYNHKLPITFIIENNELSTDTKTAEVWGVSQETMDNYFNKLTELYPNYVIHYKYERIYPHYGTGKFIDSLWKNIPKDDVRSKGF